MLRVEDARNATDEQLTEAFIRAREEGRAVAGVLREIIQAANELSDAEAAAADQLQEFNRVAGSLDLPQPQLTVGAVEALQGGRQLGTEFRPPRQAAAAADARRAQALNRIIPLEIELTEQYQEQNRNLLRSATLRDEALREDRFEQFQAAQEETNRLWREQQDEIRATEREIRNAEVAGERFGATIGDSFADAALEGESLSDVVGNLLNLFARQGISSAFSGLFGAVFGAFAGGGATARQHGGPLGAGQAAIVGEAGPELFIPRVAGTVVPNSALAGGPTFVVDMRGATTEAVARLERLVAQVNGSIETRAVSAVVSARHSDPGLFT